MLIEVIMNNKNTYYDLAIMGNYTKDKIISPTGTHYVDGGGFNYGVHVGAMMGLKVAAITRLAREDDHVVESLRKLGIEVYPFYSKQSTHMQLYYPTTDVDQRILSVSSVAEPFEPEHVRPIQSRAFLINASTRGEVDLAVIRELHKKKTLIVADVQGFIRIIDKDGTLKYDSWPGKENVLSYINVLKSDAVEAAALTGITDLKESVKKLAEFGPQEIVLTHRDGLLVYANEEYYQAPFLPDKLIGRSGRGDTCIASYMAKRLSAPPSESTIWAAAVTSLKMEAEGPIHRKLVEVHRLIKNKYSKQFV
jgi:sugar/nucleoside kinase (ribokinase family)